MDWDETVSLPVVADRFELGGEAFERVGRAESHLWRWQAQAGPRLLRLPPGHLRLVPTLPEEPLVLRFDHRLEVTPARGEVAVHAGLPVDLRIEHVPAGESGTVAAVAERSTPALRKRMALGQVEDPQLARALDVRLHEDPASVAAGLAVLPLRFRLPESGLRSLDRIMLPAGGVSLWAGGRLLYASAVEVDLRDASLVGVKVLPEVPRADVTLRYGPPSETGDFSLRAIVRWLTQLAPGAE